MREQESVWRLLVRMNGGGGAQLPKKASDVCSPPFSFAFSSALRAVSCSMFAAIVLTIIPSVLVYVFMHEKIIKGLTSGALKG